MHCPNQVAVSFQFGKAVNFLVNACACCPLRARCITSKTGRRVSTHPDAQLPQKLRQGQVTAAGRAELRERVVVEHTLAHISQWLFLTVPVTSAHAKIYSTCGA